MSSRPQNAATMSRTALVREVRRLRRIERLAREIHRNDGATAWASDKAAMLYLLWGEELSDG